MDSMRRAISVKIRRRRRLLPPAMAPSRQSPHIDTSKRPFPDNKMSGRDSAHLPHTREDIQQRQLLRLRQILEQILPANGFYRGKFARADLTLASLEQLQNLPLTSKSELIDDRRQYPPFGSNLTFPGDR